MGTMTQHLASFVIAMDMFQAFVTVEERRTLCFASVQRNTALTTVSARGLQGCRSRRESDVGALQLKNIRGSRSFSDSGKDKQW